MPTAQPRKYLSTLLREENGNQVNLASPLESIYAKACQSIKFLHHNQAMKTTMENGEDYNKHEGQKKYIIDYMSRQHFLS